MANDCHFLKVLIFSDNKRGCMIHPYSKSIFICDFLTPDVSCVVLDKSNVTIPTAPLHTNTRTLARGRTELVHLPCHLSFG